MTQWDLVVAGGEADFNLRHLIACAGQLGIKTAALLHGPDKRPRLDWRLNDQQLTLDGEALRTTAAFLRYDVFNSQPAASFDHGMAWFTTLSSWVLADPDIRMFNRRLDPHASLKPFNLVQAQRAGLAIPPTIIANDGEALDALDLDAIVKPVAGGAYTRRLTPLAAAAGESGEARSPLPVPAIVQKRMVYPEYRIFYVGGEFHIFEIYSNYVDYRPATDNRMRYLGGDFPDPAVLQRLRNFLDGLGCDYCACDFKTDPDTGAAVFLEMNSGAMFPAYDHSSDGQLCRAMIGALLPGRV